MLTSSPFACPNNFLILEGSWRIALVYQTIFIELLDGSYLEFCLNFLPSAIHVCIKNWVILELLWMKRNKKRQFRSKFRLLLREDDFAKIEMSSKLQVSLLKALLTRSQRHPCIKKYGNQLNPFIGGWNLPQWVEIQLNFMNRSYPRRLPHSFFYLLIRAR